MLQEQGPATKASQQAKSGRERDYGRSIRAAARGLVTARVDEEGRITPVLDEFQFIDSMTSTIMRGLTNAFQEGLKKAGVAPADLETAAYLPERLALDSLINENMSSLFNFSAYIIQRREKYYVQGKKQLATTQVMNRALLWSNQYDKARVTAFTMASGDKLTTWHLGATEIHCKSCLTFNGRTYRASTWAKNNALPKSSALCCGGYQCDCRTVPAEPGTPMTKGRFPAGALCN